MAENVRKRVSKWDVMVDTPVPIETAQENPLPVREYDSCMEKQSAVDWNSSNCDTNQFSECAEANQSSEWSEVEHENISISKDCFGRLHSPKISDITAGDTDGSKRSSWEPISGQSTAKDGNMPESPKHPETGDKDGSKGSCWEPISRNQATEKDGSGSGGTDGWGSGSKGSDGWGTALDQNHGTSPGFDAWRQPRRSNSPRSGWRSQSQRRSSLSRSRSRSRSPSHGLRQGSERWADRGRMGGGSAGTCRAFAAGRCTRGNQCSYLHEDGGRMEFERGRYEGHDSRENFSGSREPRDYRPSERHGTRYDGDWENPEPRRSNSSTEACYDFTKGRCRRGSSCRYVHHDASSGGGWNTKDEARERTRDRGDGDESFGRRVDPPRRVRDLPCKYFPEGRCRHGEDCKFSHEGTPLGQSDGRPRGDKRDYGHGREYNSSRTGPNWGDLTASVDGNGARIAAARSMGREDTGHGLRHPQTLNPQEQSTIREASANNIRSQAEMNSANHLLAVAAASGQNIVQSGQSQYMVSQPLHAQSFAPGIQIQQVVPQLPFNGQMQQFYTLPPNGLQNQFVVPQAPSNPQNCNLGLQSHQVLHPPHIGQFQQNFNRSLPSPHNPQSLPNFHLSGQIQQGFPIPHNVQNQRNINIIGQGQQSLFPPPQSGQSQQVAYSVAPNGPDQFGTPQPPNPQIFGTPLNSELSSNNPIAPKELSSEKAAQITNLSASLAQFFGNDPQLPQLYATLNPLGATGLAPPLQPTRGSQEPANSDNSNTPPGFSSVSVEHKDPKLAESQTILNSLAPLSATSDTNAGNQENHEPRGNTGPKEVPSGNTAPKEVNDAETGQSKREHSGHSENVDADVRTDGESNRSKDSKECRMFKCALVEFVKDVLKPAWKEGHLSKEVHKTIVKKVVEKVTGALKGSSIPQTQEKIDAYLAYSKEKLNKLVQAYLEKYV